MLQNLANSTEVEIEVNNLLAEKFSSFKKVFKVRIINFLSELLRLNFSNLDGRIRVGEFIH